MVTRIEPGSATDYPFNAEYRLNRVARYLHGDWLDYGCADGGYTARLLERGVLSVVGIDAAADRVEEARRNHPDIRFYDSEADIGDGLFDGIFMNEVFEHVADESATLEAAYRMLRPNGVLVLIAPNRGFPFEGHTMHIGSWTTPCPMPIIPWLPRSITDDWVTARNYWPGELRRQIVAHGLSIVEAGFVMPVFEGYPWIPTRVAELFRSKVTTIDRLPVIKRLGVSNLIVARRRP
jgi:SAM-dependent methyltransferase